MLCFLAVQGTYRDIEETRSRFLHVAKFSKLCHLQSILIFLLLFLFFVFDSTSLPSLSMEAVFQFKFYILRLIT